MVDSPSALSFWLPVLPSSSSSWVDGDPERSSVVVTVPPVVVVAVVRAPLRFLWRRRSVDCDGGGEGCFRAAAAAARGMTTFGIVVASCSADGVEDDGATAAEASCARPGSDALAGVVVVVVMTTAGFVGV